MVSMLFVTALYAKVKASGALAILAVALVVCLALGAFIMRPDPMTVRHSYSRVKHSEVLRVLKGAAQVQTETVYGFSTTVEE